MKMFFISFLTLAIERDTLPALKGGPQESSAKAELSASLPHLIQSPVCSSVLPSAVLVTFLQTSSLEKGEKAPICMSGNFCGLNTLIYTQSPHVMSLQTKLGRNA